MTSLDVIKETRTKVSQEKLNIDEKVRSNLFQWNGQFSPQLVEALINQYAEPRAKILAVTKINSLLLLTLLLLSGCKTIITSDIYSRDALSGKNLEFPAEILIEIPSCTSDRIEKYKQDILALFSESSKPKIADCINQGMDSFIKVKIVGLIATDSSNYDVTLFRYKKSKPINDSEIGIKTILSPKFLTRVKNFADNNMTRIDYDDLVLRLNIHNDSDTPIEIYADGGWVDGSPVQYHSQIINRREKAIFTAPNNISDLVLKQKQPIALWMNLKGSTTSTKEIKTNPQEIIKSIIHKIQSNWKKPTPELKGLVSTISIRLKPSGEVVPGSIKISKSSGNKIFDDSVIKAIKHAQPLPVPKGSAFKQFRHIQFIFDPS